MMSLTKDQPVDKDYDTAVIDKSFKEIQYNGKTYELVLSR